MAEVDITINDRSYRISCKDGEEERIKSLAKLINNQVQKLSEKIGQLGEARMILLASLVLLDKSDEAEKEAEKIIVLSRTKNLLPKHFALVMSSILGTTFAYAGSRSAWMTRSAARISGNKIFHDGGTNPDL